MSRLRDKLPLVQPKAKQSELEKRVGVVPLTVYITPEDKKRIRHLVAETGISAQQMGISAWSMLLGYWGLQPLTPTKANVPDGRRKLGSQGDSGMP